jgi:FtsP/CotA-like multicopper oxidase with cupredoxin domain
MGVLVVEDSPGEVPPEIEEMEEMVMAVLHVDLFAVMTIQETFNAQLWQAVPAITAATLPELLVNGQTAPTLAMQPGKWYRWRIAYAAIEDTATLRFEVGALGGTCELQLLAKDGVYLPVRRGGC